jgi:DHA1 family tetracycline resistance protein-like MFS transporter
VWPSVFVLYTSYRYHWTPGLTGFIMMAGSAIGIAVQTFLVGPAVSRFGERGVLAIGTGASVVGQAWSGSAPTGLLYCFGMPINSLSGLLIPGLQGLMTRLVGPAEQGQLQGANQSLMGVASVVGPLIYGLSFAWTVRHPQVGLPGLPLLLSSFTMLCCLMLALWAGREAARRAQLEAAE